MGKPGAPAPPDTGQPRTSVAKALELLELLAEWPDGMAGLAELSAAAAMPKSSVHRLLHELEIRGMVAHSGTKYRPGSRFLELASAARWSRYGRIRDLAAPVLDELCEQTGLTVHLGVLDGGEVLYIEKITAPRGSTIPTRVGARMPAPCTALGKALLAHSAPEVLLAALRSGLPRRTPYSVSVPRLFLDQLAGIRQTGFASEREESKLGLSCLAAPVLLADAPPLAVSVSGFGAEPDERRRSPRVRAAAVAIAHELERLSG